MIHWKWQSVNSPRCEYSTPDMRPMGNTDYSYTETVAAQAIGDYAPDAMAIDNMRRTNAIELINQRENKREMNNERLGERGYLVQSNQNPFFSSQSYVSNVVSRDQFLRPQISSFME